MLIQLKLENFRKHEQRVVTFADGLNVMRAPNEGGKSTLIEAALYALFGAKALRDTLANTVTWGKKENELKVELTLEVGGRLYKFTRGKSGAECEYDGGIVTGQNEVSNFAAEILGADAAAANRLMLANQNNLRGALEEGPKAVSEQIESLADFDLFDRLLEAANEKLLTGSTTFHEDKVKEAEAALAAASDFEEPDFSQFDTVIASLNSDALMYEEKIQDLEPQLRDAEADMQSAENNRRMRETLETNLRKAKEQHALHVVLKNEADTKAAVKPDLILLAQLREDVRNIEEAKARLDVYNSLVKLNGTYPELYWEGDVAGFEAEIERLKASIQTNEDQRRAVEDKVRDVLHQAKVLGDKVVTSTDCPTCGRPLEDHDEIEHRNDSIKAQIAALEEQIVALGKEAKGYIEAVADLKEELAEMQKLAAIAKPFVDFSLRYQQHLEVDSAFHPPKLTWKGSTPEAAASEEELKVRIHEIENQKDAAERAAARSESLAETIAEDVEYVARCEQQLDDCPAVIDVTDLRERVRDLGNTLVLAREGAAQCRFNITEAESRRVNLQNDYERVLREKDRAAERLQEARKDLDTLNFNNALLKKIRAARPVIADKLWGTVLAAVSTMFSSMRGEVSVVTKDKDGFKVNGAPVTSLSGSTLDLLGLAIRVSLVRTFLPNTTFLVLDEPGAAMDDDRVTQMLGFIASAGFTQTLLVTHEGISEQFADHLITL